MSQPYANYPRNPVPPGGVVCPRCSSPNTSKVSFTWWGGALAPALFKLQRCGNCRLEFNRETGKPTTTTMWIYQGVVIGIVLLIGLVVMISSR